MIPGRLAAGAEPATLGFPNGAWNTVCLYTLVAFLIGHKHFTERMKSVIFCLQCLPTGEQRWGDGAPGEEISPVLDSWPDDTGHAQFSLSFQCPS